MRGAISYPACLALTIAAFTALGRSSRRPEVENATQQSTNFDATGDPVPQQLLALTARRSTADAVRTLSLCAMHDDKQGRACRAALTVWLSEEQRLSEAERAAPAFASRFRFGSSAPVLGLAAWKWSLLGGLLVAYLLRAYLVVLTLSVVVLAARLVAATVQGALLTLALGAYCVAALLKSAASAYLTLSQHTRRQRIEDLDRQLARQARCGSGTSYEEWRQTASRRDELSGASGWRKDDAGWEAVHKHEEQLRRAARESGTGGEALMFALQPLMKRPAHAEPAVAMGGARHVTERHSHNLSAALRRLVEPPPEGLPAPSVPQLEKRLSFLTASQLSVGHTALCLSGGGALAMYHMGVVKALLEQRLLPRVISGTSGGSIVAGFLAQRTDEEMLADVCVPTVSTCLPERWFPPLHEQVLSFVQHGYLVKSSDFERTARAYYGDMTFEEGFRRSGRHVNISIASSTRGGRSEGQSVLLNHVTTPNVLIYSAVAASCALPGIMRPATLMAKDSRGRIVPMDPPGTKYVDGSLRADLPLHRLSQLFHVSQFIVSQVNPHIAPFLETPAQAILSEVTNQSGLAASLAGLQRFLFREVQHRCRALAALNMLPTLFGEDAAGVFQQRYHGSLTIVPRLDARDCIHGVISNPSVADMHRYLDEGRLKTWEALQCIQQLLSLEKAVEAARTDTQQQLHAARAARAARAASLTPSCSSSRLAAEGDAAEEQPAPPPRPSPPARLPKSSLPKASSWANGLDGLSTEESRRSVELFRDSRALLEEHSDGGPSPPQLPPTSMPDAASPGLRTVLPTLCRAAFSPRKGVDGDRNSEAWKSCDS